MADTGRNMQFLFCSAINTIIQPYYSRVFDGILPLLIVSTHNGDDTPQNVRSFLLNCFVTFPYCHFKDMLRHKLLAASTSISLYMLHLQDRTINFHNNFLCFIQTNWIEGLKMIQNCCPHNAQALLCIRYCFRSVSSDLQGHQVQQTPILVQ